MQNGLLNPQFDQLVLESVAAHVKLRDGDRQAKAPRTGASRIEVKHTIAAFRAWLV
jgi:hypothetical protein